MTRQSPYRHVLLPLTGLLALLLGAMAAGGLAGPVRAMPADLPSVFVPADR